MPGLAVRELTLSHFRSHRTLRLAPGPGLIAIHGRNGAGKTNILEAVSLLSPGRGLRRAGAEEIARRPESIGWRIRALLASEDALHEIETGWEAASGRSLRIDDKAAPQVALARLARVVWLVPAMDRLWTEAAEGRRRFLDRLTMGFAPDHADAVLAYEKAMRERNRLLKDQIRDPGWYQALEAQMAQHGAVIDANRRDAIRRIAGAQAAAETAFPAAALDLTGPEDVSDLPLAEALAASRPRDMAAGRTLVGPHRADLSAVYAAKGIEARLSSTGEQKALLISLVLATARALAAEAGAPPLILLDEIAAHLDPARRAALYAELHALGAQAWLTGTEGGLFEELGPDATHYEVTEENGASALRER